jgi:hypothetical protein
MAKKRSLQIVNEHFEPLSNAVMSSAVVIQQPVNQSLRGSLSRLNNCSIVARFLCFWSATYMSSAISFIRTTDFDFLVMGKAYAFVRSATNR